MPKQSRLGDCVKISCPHGTQIGIIASASKTTYVDSLGCARITDTVVCTTCGQSGQIISGSQFSFADTKNKAKIGDYEIGTCNPGLCKQCPHTHNGKIIQGSDYTYTT